MLNYLPNDIFLLIINLLSLNNVINLRVTNKENKKHTKLYTPEYLVYIKKPVKLTLNIYPNIELISIKDNNYITDDEFQYLNHVKRLVMSNCHQKEITDNCFKHLIKIKELNILECNQKCINGNHFTNKMFDHLSELEILEMDNNHIITNIKLEKIKELYIYNCSKITDDGISNLINLEKLYLDKINITDNVFIKLNKIQELSLIDCEITDNAIKYLPKLVRLKLVNVKNIKCKDLDKTNIQELYLSQINITDEDFKYLKNIKLLILYYLNINGDGLQYLTNIEILQLNYIPILENHLEIGK
jgi:hypothetical protein